MEKMVLYTGNSIASKFRYGNTIKVSRLVDKWATYKKGGGIFLSASNNRLDNTKKKSIQNKYYKMSRNIDPIKCKEVGEWSVWEKKKKVDCRLTIV